MEFWRYEQRKYGSVFNHSGIEYRDIINGLVATGGDYEKTHEYIATEMAKGNEDYQVTGSVLLKLAMWQTIKDEGRKRLDEFLEKCKKGENREHYGIKAGAQQMKKIKKDAIDEFCRRSISDYKLLTTLSSNDGKASLGNAESSLGNAESSIDDEGVSLGDGTASLGDGTASLGDGGKDMAEMERMKKTLSWMFADTMEYYCILDRAHMWRAAGRCKKAYRTWNDPYDVTHLGDGFFLIPPKMRAVLLLLNRRHIRDEEYSRISTEDILKLYENYAERKTKQIEIVERLKKDGRMSG